MVNHNDNHGDYYAIPAGYAFCFQDECPLADTCARRFAGRHTGGRNCCTAVLPAAREGGDCPYYKETRKIRGAWGFASLFDEVRAKDAPTLRRLVKAYLGGNGTYYQYHNGNRLLTPEQQRWVLSLFAEHGYSGALGFDGYRDVYDW